MQKWEIKGEGAGFELTDRACTVYFAAPEGEETYGDVKLGNFRSAVVQSSPVFIETLRPAWVPADGPYNAPVSSPSLPQKPDIPKMLRSLPLRPLHYRKSVTIRMASPPPP